MKTSEMIAMLEKNPKLSFKQIGEEGCDGSFIYVDFNRVIRWGGKDQSHNPLIIVLKDGWNDWQLVREPVTWQEAIQAWGEGKTVKCELPSTHASYIFKAFHAVSRAANTLNTPLSKDMLNNGTWYIEEGGTD